MTSIKGQIEALHNWLDWGKYVLIQEELNNTFLAKDGYERTVWHMAPYEGQVEVLHIMW